MPLTYNHPAPMIVKDPAQSLYQQLMLRLRGPNYAVMGQDCYIAFYACSDVAAAFLAQRIATFEHYTSSSWEDYSVYRYDADGMRTKIMRGYAAQGWARLEHGMPKITFYVVRPCKYPDIGVVTTHRWLAELATVVWGNKLWWDFYLSLGKKVPQRMQQVKIATATLDRAFVAVQERRISDSVDSLATG